MEGRQYFIDDEHPWRQGISQKLGRIVLAVA